MDFLNEVTGTMSTIVKWIASYKMQSFLHKKIVKWIASYKMQSFLHKKNVTNVCITSVVISEDVLCYARNSHLWVVDSVFFPCSLWFMIHLNFHKTSSDEMVMSRLWADNRVILTAWPPRSTIDASHCKLTTFYSLVLIFATLEVPLGPSTNEDCLL